MSSLRPDITEIRRGIQALFRVGDVIEVRILKPNGHGAISGYFDDFDALAKTLAASYGNVPGVYYTMNPVKPALLARAANRVKESVKSATADKDIVLRIRLLIDCDPVRVAGISSTDEEHEAALERAREVRFTLSAEGWPEPISGDSGNGAHLLYGIDLPNDEASARLVERVLKALSKRFSDAVVSIDTGVYNAARICKAYGTPAQKGDNIPARPHRLSKLLDIPTKIEPVSRELLEVLAATIELPPPPPRANSADRSTFNSTFSIEDFIAQHLEARTPAPHDGGRMWVLKRCPFNEEHQAPDAAIFQRADGSLGFKCFHASCSSKTWRDVRELFEGPQPQWRQANEDGRRQARAEATYNWPEPEPLGGALPPVLLFDERLLPASLRPLVLDTAERMQVPLDLPAAAVVGGLAGTVNRRACIQPKDGDPTWVVVPNLWVALIAFSGFMKSPVLATIIRILAAIEADWRRAHVELLKNYARAKEEFDLRLASWKEEFKRAAKKIGATTPARPEGEPKEPKLQRLIVNDATFEALHQTMADNPAGLLAVRDELVGWWEQLDKPGREGERAFCLQAWNGDTGHTVDRIGRGTIYVPACCISMIGGIQPPRLRVYMAETLKDGPGNDGLLQRYQLMVWPDTERAWHRVNRPADQIAQQRAEKVFRRLVELDPDQPARFLFDTDAQELFWTWLEELELKVRGNELHPALTSHLSKYRSLMPSLALLFCLADQADQVDAEFPQRDSHGQLRIPLENARQAAAFCEYLESHARRVYSSIVTPQMRAAHELGARLKRREVGTDGIFSCREVYRKDWTGLDSVESVERAIEVLQDAGWVRPAAPEPKPAGGRTAARFVVNPRIWE